MTKHDDHRTLKRSIHPCLFQGREPGDSDSVDSVDLIFRASMRQKVQRSMLFVDPGNSFSFEAEDLGDVVSRLPQLKLSMGL